jgi:hypothetical protein
MRQVPRSGASVDLYQALSPGKGVDFTCRSYPEGMRTMNNKRSQRNERRQYTAMPRFPFKDSNGATIKECRRKIPDRRTGNIQVEWINEIVIG